MRRSAFRMFLLIVSLTQLVVGIGFALQIPLFTDVWPYDYTGTNAFIFIGSIFTAAGAATLWCLWTGYDGALFGIALDYLVILIPITILTLQVGRGRTAYVNYAMAAVGAIFVGLIMALYARRLPLPAQPPLPRPVQIAFVVFIIALLIVAVALITGQTNILPWSVTATTGIIYGWMYLGAAAYFVYALLRPSWANAGGQLAGFLAYDLVLIVPFVQRLGTVEPRYQASLSIYTAVVVSSGVLAAWYLFINPATRLRWRPSAAQPATA